MVSCGEVLGAMVETDWARVSMLAEAEGFY
jgi:hypothetical protein